MKKTIPLLLLALLSVLVVRAQVLLQQTEVDTATVITGLDIPWEIQYGPDDHLWVTERYGTVSRVNPATGEKTVVLDISGMVYQAGESGLLGMAIHPEFETEPYVYLAYTYNSGGNVLERIVRYMYANGQLVEEYILLDNINGNTTHDGCRLVITPDHKLLATTGDAQDQPAAQNPDNLSGKVLRINLDGSIPDDNPWMGSPVYSLGHRNPQGLYVAPTGVVYSSEHGPSTDDEFNVILSGRNYGWPDVHGFCDLPDEIAFCEANNVVEPLAAWTPTIATSDIVIYDHPAIPEWEGRVLLTTLKNKRLYVLELDEEGMQVVGQEQYFQNLWGRLRDVCMGPDGAVYLATNGPDWGNSQPFTHRIIKVWNPDYVFSASEGTPYSSSLKVYPNPARDMLYVEMEDSWSGSVITILSSTGQVVTEQEASGGMTGIPVDRLGKGLYMVRVTRSGKVGLQEKVLIY